jgi:predicted ABC-type ATPase
MAAAQKHAIIVGGPNGAGKTTFVSQFLRETGYRYIGADLIAAEMAPDDPEGAAWEAGRAFMSHIEEAISRSDDVIIETTLSGRSFRNVMLQLRSAAYHIHLKYIFLKSPQAHVDRVAIRVQTGGHHVPTDDVIRRYSRSIANFWNTYRNLADNWTVHYNSGITLAKWHGEGREVPW